MATYKFITPFTLVLDSGGTKIFQVGDIVTGNVYTPRSNERGVPMLLVNLGSETAGIPIKGVLELVSSTGGGASNTPAQDSSKSYFRKIAIWGGLGILTIAFLPVILGKSK
jgi:hypothetical protein